MGLYLNPGNEGFQTIINGTYVDKTGLIEYVNSTINTPGKLTCFSRPRRFGKSFAAKMLCAYYDKSCDSKKLFEGLKIAEKGKTFLKHINKYDVIYLDITRFISTAASIRTVVCDIQNKVINELEEPRQVLNAKGGTSTDKTIAAAYMTGILPIKKYGTESALTDFAEFSMTEPLALTEYIGFTEKEVITLCNNYNVDFENMKQWYDGYSFEDLDSVYNPNSVMKAVSYRRIRNYWTQTETFESLKNISKLIWMD